MYLFKKNFYKNCTCAILILNLHPCRIKITYNIIGKSLFIVTHNSNINFLFKQTWINKKVE